MTTPLGVIGSLGPMEIVLILLLVAFLFGARKLPELGRGVGEGIKNFRASMKTLNEDDSAPDKSVDDGAATSKEKS
jgi:sec-independent protein translocase protein TatA